MEEISLFLRILLSTVFVASAVSKLKDIDRHESIIKEYRVLPASWSRPLSWLDAFAELFIGLFLFFGFFQSITLEAGALLLAIYSFAIAVNLLRGRREISCGCSGIVGDHTISWLLVARNLVFIAVAFWLAYTDLLAGSRFFRQEGIIVILSTWIFLATLHTVKKILRMRHI